MVTVTAYKQLVIYLCTFIGASNSFEEISVEMTKLVKESKKS